MKAAELFAGYGGLALAVEHVFNAETAWVCEWDEAPSKLLAHHFPHAPNYRDVTTVDWATVEPVNIISGGSPCQDISAAGARKGMTEGTRSNLWVSMREAIAVQQPELVVWENVRGAFSAKATSEMEYEPGHLGNTRDGDTVLTALGRVLGDLSTLGYDTQWRTIRVSDIGGAHQRARVFVLAHKRDSYTFSDRRGAGCESVGLRLHGAYDNSERFRFRGGEQAQPSAPAPDPVGLNFLPTPNTMDHLDWREGEAREKAKRRGSANGSVRSSTGNLREEVHFNFGEYAPVIERWERITNRKAPPATVLSKNGRPQLNPRFSEWLMGLPDGWVTAPEHGLNRTQQLKAIGNGVVPQQAATALAEMYLNIEKLKVQ